MEVHAHTHPPAAGHRKKWTHYFWEFVMLFLAVFCGFLAENIREHKIEKAREKTFMLLLVQDLQADIDSIKQNKAHLVERAGEADTLRTQLSNGMYKNNGSTIYLYARNVSRRRFFISADGTMQQLKNSGSLRLVHNRQIVEQIIAYDVSYRTYIRQLEVEKDLVNDYRSLAARMFDANIFQNIATTNYTERPPGNPVLFDNSPAAINELCNRINYIMGVQFRLVQLLDELKEKAAALVSLLKKVYKI